MLFTQAKGHKIVSTSTAETVGKVDDFVVDPMSHSVLALVVKKASNGDVLPWPSITAFGLDAVTVPDDQAITAADEKIAARMGKDHRIIGKRVLSTRGDDLGVVGDVEFDAETSEITAVHVGNRPVDGDRLVGVGSYAVVVRAD